MKCLLGIDPEKTQKCKPSECASCGWEAAEAARRREYVKEHGLTLCADGFRRLIIKKENDMATPYKECPLCGAHLDSGEKCECRAERRLAFLRLLRINAQQALQGWLFLLVTHSFTRSPL